MEQEKKHPPVMQVVPAYLAYNYRMLLLPSTLVMLAMMAVLKYLDDQFTNEAVPFGMISFEFAFTKERAIQARNSWNDEQRYWVVASLMIGKRVVFSERAEADVKKTMGL